MSPQGRPKGELTPKREARRFVNTPQGRPKGELTPKREARRLVDHAYAGPFHHRS
jgi:hypothetical protein